MDWRWTHASPLVPGEWGCECGGASWLRWTRSVLLLGAGELSMQPSAPALFVPLLMALWREGGPSVWLS